MSEITQKHTSRREFLKNTGRIAATSTFVVGAVPRMYAAEDNTIKLALVGCGGRGSGAAADAMSVRGRGPIELVAMADVFENRLAGSYQNLKEACGDKGDVPPERRFIGFDAYKKAMDCLRPGDVAILATPPAFRWVHFGYAVEKGLNVFMEKPVTVDGPTTKKMLKLADTATAKNLKVGVGLMSRHSRAFEELHQRIQDGEIGDIILMRGYRMHGPAGFFSSVAKPPGVSELLYQVQRFHSFLWASGGNFSDFYIHHIDHLCWMKNAWPVEAQALGGRHYRQSPEGQTYVDQNFDVYAVEYTFADGSKMNFDGRCMTGCSDIYSSYAHGSKGMAIVSRDSDCGLPSSTYKGQNPDRSNLIWESRIRRDQQSPYQNEWDDLVDAIRNDKAYNEAECGAIASLVTSMGRMAAHTGNIITYDQMLNCPHEMAPDVDKLTMDSPAPLRSNAQGIYPVPQPGIVTDREYRDFA
ncbi:MAG: Gfo/Idh/MocA family oxidoreductase [Sedimentisphaerales bacterium]|nr:Gfo/Idh/MocA family oxidoreductase [Sedimentisphaerales bacterium]